MKRRRGETETDRAKVDAMTEEELEAIIAEDEDEAGWEWGPAFKGIPQAKNRSRFALMGTSSTGSSRKAPAIKHG
jgi:hypothetical protein